MEDFITLAVEDTVTSPFDILLEPVKTRLFASLCEPYAYPLRLQYALISICSVAFSDLLLGLT